jgi:hypothetical protein
LQRINLSLRPRVLFGLDVIARDRNVSLSQAVEYVFSVAARAYTVDGKSLSELANNVDALEDVKAAAGLFVDAHDGKDYPPEEQAKIASDFFRQTGLARAYQMPPNLRTAEERYLLEVYETPGKGYWKDGGLLRELAARGFRDGLPPKDIADEWRGRAEERIRAKSGEVRAKPRSRKR